MKILIPSTSNYFLLEFDNGNLLSPQVSTCEIDDIKKTFEITFMVPEKKRDEFLDQLNFSYFYLKETDRKNSSIISSEIYHVKKFTKRHRKYDYGSTQPLIMTIIGIFK